MEKERKMTEKDKSHDCDAAISKIKNKAVIFVYFNGHGGVDVDRDETDDGKPEFTEEEKKLLKEQKVERSTYGYTILNKKIYLDKFMKDL